MRVFASGGTINADLQCGSVRTNGHVGKDLIVVMNTCKDFLPSQYWVCVCLSGLRYIHMDSREFGVSRSLDAKFRKPHEVREHMVSALGERFDSASALWAYARQHDLPRILYEDACRRCGIELDDVDRAVAADHNADRAEA